jgi:hypothetical protein
MFRLAIVVGLGVAAWYWRREILSIVDTQLPGVREEAARAFDEVAESAERAFEQTRSRLSNA